MMDVCTIVVGYIFVCCLVLWFYSVARKHEAKQQRDIERIMNAKNKNNTDGIFRDIDLLKPDIQEKVNRLFIDYIVSGDPINKSFVNVPFKKTNSMDFDGSLINTNSYLETLDSIGKMKTFHISKRFFYLVRTDNGMWFRFFNKYGISIIYDIRHSTYYFKPRIKNGFYIKNTFIQILK